MIRTGLTGASAHGDKRSPSPSGERVARPTGPASTEVPAVAGPLVGRSHTLRCRSPRRVLIFTMGVGIGLNVLTGTAFATPSTTNPSDAKFECSDSHNSNTDHGANNDDGYQSTCDPTDFGGNGQEFGPGLQTGKPCAGCVGNADDKNPPGQYPDGSDGNSGYECDGRDRPFVDQNGNGNHGIGDENPAHTGCTSETVTTPPDDNPTCPDGSAMPTTDQDGNGQINAADCN